MIDKIFNYSLSTLENVDGNSEAEEFILCITKNEIEKIEDKKEKNKAIELFLNKFEEYDGSNTFKSVKDNFEKQNDIEQLKKIAKKKKNALINLHCTLNTVHNVSYWYDDLSKEKKEIVDEIYNFGVGIKLFTTFFKTNQMADMMYLHKHQSYFGKEQYIVIKGFCRNSASFQELKGKSFKEAYKISETWFKDQTK